MAESELSRREQALTLQRPPTRTAHAPLEKLEGLLFRIRPLLVSGHRSLVTAVGRAGMASPLDLGLRTLYQVTCHSSLVIVLQPFLLAIRHLSLFTALAGSR
jgi:hypothetical protein